MTIPRSWFPLLPVAVPLSLVVFAAAAHFAAAKEQPPRPKPSAPAAKAVAPAPREGTALFAAARSFLSALTPPQRARAVFPFDAEERLVWHYVPMPRRGIGLGEMDEKQRAAVRELLQIALSAAGYKKVETIRTLETVLREVENGGPNSVRNPDSYYLTVFGTPSPNGAWGLRYEGHHLSLHWTMVGGRVVASTPQFLGANPARVGRRASTAGPGEGTTAMPGEETIARELARSLTAGGKPSKGVLPGTPPGDILSGARPRAQFPEASGMTFAELDAKQRGLLLSLIREHAAVQTDAVAARRLDVIRKAGLESVRFVWIGGVEPGQGHYYRIQGKTFLIEYDNTQNRANHIHTVWRDTKSDFGDDALAAHYRAFKPGTVAGRDHGHDHPHPHPHP